MSNIAVIIAGGVGSRMHLDIPKQFIHIKGKPIIIYTLEAFQRHPDIDAIEVVCLEGWQDSLTAYAKQYGITKLKYVISGGNTAQESIRNGVFYLEDKCGPDDILIIHDGIRPLVDEAVLSDVIVKCRQHGNAVTSLPYNEQMFIADDEESTTRYIPRETLRRVSTPQAYKFPLICEKYHEAFTTGRGITGSSYTNTMMADLGVRLYFAAGSDRNIKLTTKEDLELFSAYLSLGIYTQLGGGAKLLTHNAMYIEDVQKTADLNLQWEKLNDASVLITGASGLIGTFLVDVLMHRNKNYSQHCRISAMGRNEEKARKRFSEYFDLHDEFEFIAHDVNLPLKNFTRNYDFILHMASNTHPLDYSRDPVGTINANIIGLNNLLSFSREHLTQRFMFASTVEVYGNNRGDTEFFDENYCGYIDISKARSGYPESKRCGETLCQSYIQQYGLDIVIPRFSRTYGPTMQENDSKAIAQFIRKSIAHEDIVLKSEGTQLYSYTYAPDAISGLLTVLFNGRNGDAYNIADEGSDITLKELAQTAANHAGRRVVFELPDENERRGYSLAMKARLDASKLKALGWNALYDIKTGITRTIDILAQEMAS